VTRRYGAPVQNAELRQGAFQTNARIGRKFGVLFQGGQGSSDRAGRRRHEDMTR
jgi:hypothetical protein